MKINVWVKSVLAALLMVTTILGLGYAGSKLPWLFPVVGATGFFMIAVGLIRWWLFWDES